MNFRVSLKVSEVAQDKGLCNYQRPSAEAASACQCFSWLSQVTDRERQRLVKIQACFIPPILSSAHFIIYVSPPGSCRSLNSTTLTKASMYHPSVIKHLFPQLVFSSQSVVNILYLQVYIPTNSIYKTQFDSQVRSSCGIYITCFFFSFLYFRDF